MKKIAFIVFLYLLNQGCLPEEKSPLFEARIALKNDLSEYTNKAKSVGETIDNAEMKINNSYEKFKNLENPSENDFKKVARKWQSEYINIAEEIDLLQKDFIDVQNSSDIFLNEIDAVLRDLEGHMDELEFENDVSKKKNEYKSELIKAQNAISQIELTLKRIDRFDKVMILYYALDNLDSQIRKLRKITQRAKNIVTKLEESSKNGFEILDNKP